MPLPPLKHRSLWHWLPALIVALVGVAASIGLWSLQRTLTHDLERERFQTKLQGVVEALQQQVDAQVDLLAGLRSLLSINPHLSRGDFEWAVGQLDVPRTHPSVAHLDFTRIVPAPELQVFEARARADPHLGGRAPLDFAVRPLASLSEYFVTDFVWPVAGNEDRLGLELHALPVALEAFARARRTGQLTASAPLLPPQESGMTLSLPVFDHRRGFDMEQGFIGTIGLTVQVPILLQALQDDGALSGLSLAISDVGLIAASQASPARMLAAHLDEQWDTSVGRRVQLPVGGRRWQLQFMPTPELLSAVERQRARTAAITTLLITALLTALVALLSLRRRQAQDAAAAAHRAQQSSEERFRAVFNQAAVGIAQLDAADGRVVRANQHFCDLLGHSEAELRTMRFADYIVAEDVPASREALGRLTTRKTAEARLETRYRRRSGELIWADVSATLLRPSRDEAESHLVVVQDISNRKRMELALARSEERLREIFNHMPVGVAHVDQGKILFLNARHVQICGYGVDEVPEVDLWWQRVVPDATERARALGAWRAARAAADYAPDGAIQPVTFMLTAKGGTRRPVELSGMALGSGHIVVLVDESQRKQAEQEIAYLAHTDVLTGLANRRGLLDRLQQALKRSARFDRHGAVLMLGLDRFKAINETYGHDVGDHLLALVARRLSARVPVEDTVARHGGDVFVIVLSDLARDAREAAVAAEDLTRGLLKATAEPFDVGLTQPVRVTLSVGVALFRGADDAAEELIKRGDMAMYAAKAAGHNTLRFFDPAMQAAIAGRVQLENELRAGLEAGQFELYYQPKVQDGRVVGAEALVRWNHPTRGLVSPAQFIALAEESGLILPLGEWVMRAACEQLTYWSSHPLFARLGVSVNVSALQFRQADFTPQVLALLARTGAPTRALTFELTESMLLNDVEGTIARMAQLKGYGVNFSLDDFGTGYSSLSYLKRLPLDEIKIDQSFVRHVLTDPNEAAIARTIVTLGASLGLQVIAEGVETEEQRAFLERNGCDTWQGYLLSPPVALDEFEALVLERAGRPSQWADL